ncbi:MULTISPECIES: sugar isomerase [unclassified Cellulophaga]|uniref:sugar isomerase n=1 Tax=unclassified Cellulophaga TaxID=2634405 RepID=UPI0026E25C29|nr:MULTISPECIES: sugar isomerase [unclassified Cellulophaga]MDO6491271.1 sugar isomerase [Cellulophaga sp. 2_MG-2023]MDO6495196.1 sugar isomerase [Cellulophaga sp. 3_MG-2023]
MTAFSFVNKKITPEQIFMTSVLVVNGGNYLYNLILGRMLGPAAFADAALLITLLLVLSFVGMTFQLVTTKFNIIFSGNQWSAFENYMKKYAVIFGVTIGALLFLFAENLQQLFNTESSTMFRVFAIGIPLYFIMSIKRGKFQGKQDYTNLSVTYQSEMWSRLLITLVLLLLVPMNPAFLVAVGIVISFVFGLMPVKFKKISFAASKVLTPANKKKVTTFILLTAGYELTQIIINNSDVLLVKHYFNSLDAGLYASLALIGRVVYFVAWMFVMLLLPAVIEKRKEGKRTAPILFKYVGYISLLSLVIVGGCYFFPETIISLMFGDAYVAMSSLLWQYALATSLFAISNIFAYYFLSLDYYVPVILSGVLGLSQIVLIIFFHSSLAMVVQLQIIVMLALLFAQLLYFSSKRNI